MAWKKDSRRHALASKGIRTAFTVADPKVDSILKRRVSPYFEMDLSKHGLPFIRELYDEEEHMDRKKGIAYDVVIMETEEYLKACEFGQNIKIHVEEDKRERIMEGMMRGDKFQMPHLEYRLHSTRERGRLSQEGIHRSIVSRELGEKWIPVIVIYPSVTEDFEKVKNVMTHHVRRSIDQTKIRTEAERKREHGEDWHL